MSEEQQQEKQAQATALTIASVPAEEVCAFLLRGETTRQGEPPVEHVWWAREHVDHEAFEKMLELIKLVDGVEGERGTLWCMGYLSSQGKFHPLHGLDRIAVARCRYEARVIHLAPGEE